MYFLIRYVANLSVTKIFQLHFQCEIICVCMIDDDERFSDVILLSFLYYQTELPERKVGENKSSIDLSLIMI